MTTTTQHSEPDARVDERDDESSKKRKAPPPAILWRLASVEERDEVRELATDHGMTVQDYVTWKTLGRKPPVNPKRPGPRPAPRQEEALFDKQLRTA